MTPTAELSLYCPPMAIRKVTSTLRMTAEEPMEATIRFPDGHVLSILPVVIPPTKVFKIGTLHWMVSACRGEGVNFDNSLRVDLPREEVVWRWYQPLYMVALAIDAPAYLILADGSEWEGSVRFPDCRSNIFTMTAEAVTAIGLLKQVVTPRSKP